jgi:uncharacterized membrane protein (UPF0127 family)
LLRNLRNGRIVATEVIPAFTSKSRRTGLLGREQFPEGHALVIAPSNAVHTFFMRFPIDLAFVNKGGRILKTRTSVVPWRLSAALLAYAVIELPAGSLARSDTLRGDTLLFEVISPRE